MIADYKKLLFPTGIIALLLCAATAFSQDLSTGKKKTRQPQPAPQQPMLPPQLMPPHPQNKMSERYFNIDAKRMIESPESEDALPRSREFKRIDSTYYVGWMFEGIYKFNHSADYLGYKNAAVPLERALNLLEHDYAKALSTRTDQLLVFYPIRFIMLDYTQIAYYLMQCYNNTEQPDKAFALLRRTQKWNLQMDWYMDTYNFLAWTIHRNRFYTSLKYPFLKNSIEANEKLANSYLDSGMRKIVRNRKINEQLKQFFPGYEQREWMSVYHYKNMLYAYAFNIDSADHYFGLMREAGRLPHNNYANFLVTCGNFRTAEEEYRIASQQDMSDKRLQEWAYYTSILDLYKANTKRSIVLARDMIKAAGSTPGYGWYNIALARAMLYDGQVSESQRYADKAAEFKELHIGTTLGQSHYDFSIQLLKLIGKELSWEMDKFEHRNWWYNPSVLLDMSRKMSDKYLQQFLIINQFAQNPERDRVIYKLFSTESTVSWDEIWYLIHDFSTNFFVRRFEQEAVNEKRERIRKYFALFVARLKMQQGKYDEGKKILERVRLDPNVDPEYEKLFVARIYQAEAECAAHDKNEAAKNDWLYRMYKFYPQLVPFTGMQMNMNLHVTGTTDKEVENSLRSCNINWVTDLSVPAPDAYVSFHAAGNKKTITYYVIDRSGNTIVPKQTFAWQKADEAGKTLAYRLFNIGGKEEEEKK